MTREWLKSASDDLKTIETLLPHPDLTNIIAFHAQQTFEKAIKAIIEEHDMPFIKTHSLETLFMRVKEKIPFVLMKRYSRS